MRHGLTFAVLGTLLMTSPVQAQVLLSDNFDAETTGLDVSGLTNWNIGGVVDVVNDNTFGIRCAGMSGKCIDLDGSSPGLAGPRSITTKESYSFMTGDRMRISFAVSGNQRSASTDRFFTNLVFGSNTSFISYLGTGVFGGSDENGVFASTFSAQADIQGNFGFIASSFEFVAGQNGSLQFALGTTSADNVGPVLDNVVIERFAASVPEPSSLALLGLGLAGLVASRRRRVA
jgi:hypothetical protein